MKKYGETLILSFQLIFYVFLSVACFKSWEFTNDDAIAALLTKQIANSRWLLFGPQSSFGILHTGFIYNIYAVFYWLFPKLVSLQICVLYFLVIMHAVLIKTSEGILTKRFSYIVSLLFFFSPAFALFYNQKFWEPAILPAFTVLSFYALVQYVRNGKWVYLWGSILFLTIAISCHLLAVVLYFPLLFILFKFRVPRHPLLYSLVLLLTALVGVSSWLLWLGANHPWSLWTFTLPVPLYFLARKITKLERAALYGLIIVLFIAFMFAGPSGICGAVQAIVDLCSTSSLYLPRHMGWLSFSEGTNWFYPEVLLLSFYFYKSIKNYDSATLEEKLLLIWILGAIFSFLIATSFCARVPHQWACYIFPLLWVAIVKPLSDFFASPKKLFRAIACLGVFILLTPAISYTVRYAERLKREDATGWHAASLGLKEKVLWTIWEQSKLPVIFLASSSGYTTHDFYAWSYLNDEMERPQARVSGDEQSFWYIHTNGALQEDPTIHAKLKGGCEKFLVAGYVELFRCKKNLFVGIQI